MHQYTMSKSGTTETGVNMKKVLLNHINH
uniref:Uncharacterized protein n=1 Tax=Arundo donax TaxID=35708 RepID=A0A0A9FZG5_ARUDO